MRQPTVAIEPSILGSAATGHGGIIGDKRRDLRQGSRVA